MRTGRPKISDKEKKGQIMGVRLRSTERELLEKAASFKSQKLSDWMRKTLVEKALRQVRART
jgi:uncharacterized protein (DUF1778 family)